MCDEHDATGSDLCWHHRAHTKQPSLSFQLGMDASPCDFMPSVSVLHARFVIPSYFRQKPLINVHTKTAVYDSSTSPFFQEDQALSGRSR